MLTSTYLLYRTGSESIGTLALSKWAGFKGAMGNKALMLFVAMMLAASSGVLAQELTVKAPPAVSPTKASEDIIASPNILIYQLFPRVFGNKNPNNVPWGSLDQNGSGKFADITDAVLTDIRAMGVTHVWYTGVLHHASLTDYSAYGLSKDDADVVKGVAGSPYAIRDYYNVDPDLALSVPDRLEEFKALIARTHKAGLKVLIDVVPNHVARRYRSPSQPHGADLGARDDTSVEFSPNNNFYYVPGKAFEVPPPSVEVGPPSGDAKKEQDGHFLELPAKWTGNGSEDMTLRHAPANDDWYETVKLNFGDSPDGKTHYPALPDSLAFKPIAEHQAFWASQSKVPDTWLKMRDITRFWLDLGVDGFRFDMAEMIPVPFWSFLVSDIKAKRPDALLVAEVYKPERYREFIGLGKLDLLYDKVGMYDTLKLVSQGKMPASEIQNRLDEVVDIKQHMLHFLENHDEQRIASPAFLGSGENGLAALAVSLFATDGPFLLYFGQSLGEDGSELGGFGKPSRTSIFDYVSAPTMVRYLNQGPNGRFGDASLPEERALHQAYLALLSLYPNIKSTPLTALEYPSCVQAKPDASTSSNRTAATSPSAANQNTPCNVVRIRRGNYLIEANLSNRAQLVGALEGIVKVGANHAKDAIEMPGPKARLILALPVSSKQPTSDIKTGNRYTDNRYTGADTGADTRTADTLTTDPQLTDKPTDELSPLPAFGVRVFELTP